MITNVIVVLSIALCVAFALAWWLLPGLRDWLERPKHHFQQHVAQYDRERGREAAARRGSSA